MAGPAAAQVPAPWTGGETPPLALVDLEGGKHSIEDYRGKVVLVNFWATWCEPCRDEMPSIGRLKSSLAGQPFVVLAVNLAEPESRIRAFREKVPMDFPVLLDKDRAVAKRWNARVLPATYLLGPDGRIRYSYRGELDWSAASVRKLVAGLLPR
ncbi:MAG: peroxiredoxin family protein [Burkholderiales bacterium]